jgi:hypothetical protein
MLRDDDLKFDSAWEHLPQAAAGATPECAIGAKPPTARFVLSFLARTRQHCPRGHFDNGKPGEE